MISLESEAARRAPLVQALTDLGIAHEVFFAMDGRHGLPPEAEPLVDRAGAVLVRWREVSDAEFACALSHQAVYAEILARGLPGAVVLEDDVQVGPAFRRFLEARAWGVADMVLLDHSGGLVARRPPRRIVDGVMGHRIATPPYGATGYTLSARAARIIRRRSLPLRAPADWPCNIARLDCVAALPRIVAPNRAVASVSTLSPSRRPMQQRKIRPRFPRLRRLHEPDFWFLRLGIRLGRPLE